MKILQINKYHYVKGGADAVFFNTVRLLIDNGHEVITFTTESSNDLPTLCKAYKIDSPEIRSLSTLGKVSSIARFFYNSKAISMLEDIINLEKPDVAHIHLLFNAFSLPIVNLLKRLNVPIVYTVHDTRLLCPSSNYMQKSGRVCSDCNKWLFIPCVLHRCYQGSLLNSLIMQGEMIQKEYIIKHSNSISHYHFVSDFYRKHHIDQRCYFTIENTSRVYNFIPRLSKQYLPTTRGSYFLYYGRLTQEKGLLTLCEVARLLPNIQFIFVGTGPLFDLISSMNITNIKLLGFKTGEELTDLIQNANFVIVPSIWYENNPMTIIESYALGKPVIGANIGGIPEIIIDDKLGFLFESRDVDSLASAVLKASNMSLDTYICMSQECHRFALYNFSSEVVYEQLLSMYDKLVNR